MESPHNDTKVYYDCVTGVGVPASMNFDTAPKNAHTP